MNRIFISFISFLILISAQSQEMEHEIIVMPGSGMRPNPLTTEVDTAVYYSRSEVEVSSKPKDGWDAFYAMLKTLDYPQDATKNKENTIVTIVYHISRFGELTTITVEQNEVLGSKMGTCKSCQELAKTFMHDTEWTPASINGTQVNSTNKMDVIFHIYEK